MRRARSLRRLACAATICFCPLTLPADAAHADSIWQRRDQRAAWLFTDTRARQVGDLLTVVVRENTDIGEREQRQMRKDTGFSGFFKAKTKEGDADFSASGGTNRKFDGSAQYSSDRRFIDRMTVSVVDVLPNGNLLVEGTRSRLVSGEMRTLRISGIVRPIDITGQNQVESRFIGNFQVAYMGRGPETQFTNQGWFNRIMNYLWPF